MLIIVDILIIQVKILVKYAEFLIAAANKKKLLSKTNVKQAFDLFDMDHSGFISPDEIKSILGIGKRFSEDMWKTVIEEVDKNKDGQVSYEEFEAMMMMFTS